MQGVSTDRRSIGHGIVREDIKEREVESLKANQPCHMQTSGKVKITMDGCV